MISHQYKCIFVHIPRCGGSSIEAWIAGKDWWLVERETKHMLASQAKIRYREHWDNYFKFSIVRNPLSRVVSCLMYGKYFGININKNGDLDFAEYHRQFGADVVVEMDYRFHRSEEVRHSGHKPNQIYMNILDEPVDRIFKFEELREAGRELQDILRIRNPLNHWKQRSTHQHQPTDATIQHVRKIYREDIRLFSYSV